MAEQEEKPASPNPPHEKKWIDTIATASTALIAFGTLLNWFFGRQASFPHWFFYVLTIFILIIVYKYFEESIRRLIQAMYIRNYLRQAHFQLIDSLQRFSELVTQRSDDSIVKVLQDVSTRQGRDIVDHDLYGYTDQLIANIFLKLSGDGGQVSVGEFKGALADLGTLVKYTTHFYFKKPLYGGELNKFTADEVKSVELARENYADFLRRFQIFYDEAHAKIGSSTRAHFEIPKPLSWGMERRQGGE